MSNQLILIRDAMAIVGVKSYSTFKKNYLYKGLPVVKIGETIKIDKSDLNDFILSHKVMNEGRA